MENAKTVYMHNEIKLARMVVAYLWEEMWQLHAFVELCYNKAQSDFYHK